MRVRSLIIGFVIILWAVTIVSAYFVVHRPLPLDLSLTPLFVLIDVFLGVTLTALAGGLGQRFVGRFKFGVPLEKAAVELGFGVGLLGMIVFGMGLTGLLERWIIRLGVFIGLILLRKNVKLWLIHFLALKDRYQEAGTFGRILAFAIFLMISFSLMMALGPPLKWDSLVYHLELPKQYLEASRILYLSDNQFVGSPQLVEMNFTAAMALRSGTTAAVYGWIIGVIALFGVGGFASRLYGAQATFLAPMILLTGSSISEGLSWAYTDIWVLLFGLGMIVGLDNYVRSRQRSFIVIAAVFAGFAASVKYSGVILLAIATLVLLFDYFARGWASRSEPGFFRVETEGRGGRTFLDFASHILLFVGIAVLVVSPWLIKNIAFTRNPVYPFFFEGGDVDHLRQSFYLGPTPQRTLMDDLKLPWDATILGVENTPGYSSSISPLLLVLIPAAFLTAALNKKRVRNELTVLSVFAILTWIFWGFGAHISNPLASSRLYYGLFPAFVVIACAGFEYLSDIKIPGLRVNVVVSALILLTIFLSLISMTYQFVEGNTLKVLLGTQSKEEYLFQNLGWFAPAMNTVNSLPSTAKVAFLWESRAYYCEIDCSPDVIIDRWWYFSRGVGDSLEIAEILREGGVTHILIHETGVEFVRNKSNQFTDTDWQLLDEFISNELQLVEDIGNAYTLYTLGPT